VLGIAVVTRIVDALAAFGAGETGEPAALLHADTAAVGPAVLGIAGVARVVDADMASWTLQGGDAAAVSDRAAGAALTRTAGAMIRAARAGAARGRAAARGLTRTALASAA
jgi:hypothetical protein